MRERIEYQPIDPDKLFSWRRFEDGFKKGTRQVFQTCVIVTSVATILSTTTDQSEVIQTMSDIAPEQILAGTAIALLAAETIYSIPIGALNSFRPTSKFFRSPIEANFFDDIRRFYTYLQFSNI